MKLLVTLGIVFLGTSQLLIVGGFDNDCQTGRDGSGWDTPTRHCPKCHGPEGFFKLTKLQVFSPNNTVDYTVMASGLNSKDSGYEFEVPIALEATFGIEDGALTGPDWAIDISIDAKLFLEDGVAEMSLPCSMIESQIRETTTGELTGNQVALANEIVTSHYDESQCVIKDICGLQGKMENQGIWNSDFNLSHISQNIALSKNQRNNINKFNTDPKKPCILSVLEGINQTVSYTESFTLKQDNIPGNMADKFDKIMEGFVDFKPTVDIGVQVIRRNKIDTSKSETLACVFFPLHIK